MNWLAIIAALLPLLLKLLEWLQKREASGDGLTPRQVEKLNRVVYRMNAVRGLACKMGCSQAGVRPDGDE